MRLLLIQLNEMTKKNYKIKIDAAARCGVLYLLALMMTL